MSIEVITALAGSAAVSEVAKLLWDAVRTQLKEKGIEDVPADISSPEKLDSATKVLTDKAATISQDDNYAVTVNTLAAAQHSAADFRNERRRQAGTSFNIALGFSVVGVAIILIGVILLFAGEAITEGTITTAIGAVSEIIGLLLFKMSKDANGSYDKVGEDLTRIERAKEAAGIAKDITDPEKRDEALRELARSLAETPPKKAG